ncbi:MAG: A/G-specific adenine glycosylase [Paracoccaceae bacterium]
MCEHDFATALLAWYDINARPLPWRVGPLQIATGQKPDPYRVWLSEIMLQQTTVATVKSYYQSFTARWPTVKALAAADDADVMAEWAGLGYYARARNLLNCSRIVVGEYGGKFPRSRAELLRLPGIGPYTAAAISAIAFGLPETVVDGNVERVMARYFAFQDTLDLIKPQLFEKAAMLTPRQRPGDYAQAVMDLGATVCTPRSPACGLCPCMESCQARAMGLEAQLPRKPVKSAKPTRNGIVYVARRKDGAWLLERRPEKGLLGGMLGWPGSDWCDDPKSAPPFPGSWQPIEIIVKHTFTHFHLKLSVQTISAPQNTTPTSGSFIANDAFQRTDLPTVMRKVFDASAPVFNLD